MKSRRTKKYTRNNIFSIGIIPFMVILVYVLSVGIIYINKPKISLYEVVEKKISDNNTCLGIIIKDEEIIKTEQSGYLNFYYSDCSRIGKNKKVYTVDETGEIYDILKQSSSNTKFTTAQREQLRENISNFRNNYSQSNYQTVSDFLYELDNTVLELSNSGIQQNIEQIIKDNNITTKYSIINSNKSGIISYTMDGYEELTADSITANDFEMKNYEKVQLRTNEKVEKGEPAYKIVTEEDWSIIIKLSEEVYNELVKLEESSISKVTINFEKNKITTTVPFRIFTKKDGYYAELTMENYLIHFINERFTEVEIQTNTEGGLKIPVTSITEKEFYTIPSEYLTVGKNGSDSGIMKEINDEKGELSYKFVEADSYYTTEEGIAYIDKSLLEDGVWIRNQETQERYQIGLTDKLKGVYNVNYGYCLFRVVNILHENEEYCIVESGLKNGVANYDHIVVDATIVTEDDLINKYKGE